MLKKIFCIIIFIGVGGFCIWTGFLWKFFSHGYAGSLPYVETWTFKVKENQLINIIKNIKKENLQLQPPDDTTLIYGRDSGSVYYNVAFYYPDTKQVVHTLIGNGSDPANMELLLYGFEPYEQKRETPVDSLQIQLNNNNSPEIQEKSTKNWLLINKDFNYFANRKELKKFDHIIVDKINEKLKLLSAQ